MTNMGKHSISELYLYRWRYWFGYGLVAVGLIAVLIFAGLYAPGGISGQEMQSVIKSSSINYTDFGTFTMTNLPYHVLQQSSLAIFGVSILSIKLPSIILAFLSAIGLILLLRNWFKPRIAVLASLIAITTGQFIFIAQDGTPGIMYLFWPVLLILLASIISRKPTRFRMFFKISFCIAAAVSLYNPLSIYVLIALVTAILLHPHLRFLIRQLSKPKIIIGMIVALALSIPLIVTIITTPNLGLTLLGVPTQWPDFGANFTALGAEYLGFIKPGGTTLMTPFFELGSMLIIAIGAYYMIRTRETAKSYVIGLWILCLIPFIILNPSFTSITFLPLVILLASGLNALLTKWYGLFPRNPYARIAGLIPVIILVAVLVTSGIDRYAYGYRYDPNIVPNFSNDLKLIPSDTKNLVVSDNELEFYRVVATHNKQLVISTTPTSDTFLVSREANRSFKNYVIKQIIVSSNSNQSDRFYLYTKR